MKRHISRELKQMIAFSLIIISLMLLILSFILDNDRKQRRDDFIIEYNKNNRTS